MSGERTRPLSEGQKGFWVLERQGAGGSAYHSSFAVRIKGSLDVPALARAVDALVARHRGLRAVFPERGGAPTQVYRDRVDTPLPVLDGAGLDEAGVIARLIEESRRPFDLARGPLFRARLLRLGAKDHALLLSAHHIIVDQPSWPLLARELGAFYEPAAGGRRPGSPGPSADYAAYVEWQAAMLAGGKGEALRRYWLRELGGELPVLDLPTDRPRPAAGPWNGGFADLRLGSKLATALRGFARGRRKTLYATLLAAYDILLHRHGGGGEVVVGCPTTGSRSPLFEALPGSLVNPVALRCDLADDPRVDELLERVQAKVLAALAHREFPFPRLVKELRPPRDGGRLPVFQTALNLVRPFELDDFGGLRLEPLDLPQQEGQFDLDLAAFDRPDGLLLRFRYDARLFDAETVSRMADRYRLLLEGMIDSPGSRVRALPMLTDVERSRLLIRWNDTARRRPRAALHELVERQAARSPGAVAVRCGAEQWTYRELDDRASALARRLTARGIGPGRVVGVLLERSLDMVAAILAALKAGAAYLPLDPDWPDERLSFALADSDARALLTRRASSGRQPLSRVRPLFVDEDAGTEAGASARPARVGPSDAAYVIYTSGSTGRPKGVVNVHAGVCNRLLWMQEAYDLAPTDVVLQKTPTTFDVSVWELFWPLLAGAKLVLARPDGHKDPAYLARLIREERITTAHFVPPMLRAFLEQKDAASCASLKRVFCSGDVLTPEIQRLFFSRLKGERHNLYGPTEASIDVTAWRCRADDDTARGVPIGRPIANTRLYILDALGQPVPVGVTGELFIGGVGVARGYLNRPELTRERFLPDPFAKGGGTMYRTGDLCRWRRDGVVEFLGRGDHQAKIRGVRVEPGEVSAALERHESVRACVVVVREHRGDKQLVAYVTSRTPRPTEGTLRVFLGGILPEALLPSAFVFLDELPLTATGKLDRTALPPPDPGRLAAKTRGSSPRDPVERRLLRIWERVLGVRGLGVFDDFFEAGGDSLTSVEVALKAAEAGLTLSSTDVLQKRTVAALAAAIARPPSNKRK